MRKADFYSPIGFIWVLKEVKRNNSYRVIQMNPQDFKDYSVTARCSTTSSVHFF